MLKAAVDDLTTGEALMPEQQQPIADAVADAMEALARVTRRGRPAPEPLPRATPEQIEAARAHCASLAKDELEVDDDARVSVASDGDGVWVQGWVWVPNPDDPADWPGGDD